MANGLPPATLKPLEYRKISGLGSVDEITARALEALSK